jgi:hypothetical protein
MNNITALDNQALTGKAPSIFAEAPSSKTSSKYSFISTAEVVSGLRNVGWYPFDAQQSVAKAAHRQGFQKHVIQFRREQEAHAKHGDVPVLVMVNSHDGKMSYQLHAGIFRIVCENGLIAANTLFNRIAVRHVGKASDVIEASFRVLDSIPLVMDSVGAMRDIQLSRDEQLSFATQALGLRYGTDLPPVSADQVLELRREQDKGADLWRTFNVVQEHLIQGGLTGVSGPKKRRIKTMPLKAIDASVALNKGLWKLAETVKEKKLKLIA